MHPCEFFRSDQINNAKNNWVGVNVSGFSDPEFDAACEAAKTSLPGEESYQEYQVNAQAIFNQNMPAIPLYQLLRISVTRKDLCGYGMDPTSRSSLWSLEQIDYGPGCK
jgi:peptide/nickel transport system substrate-binding protein